MALKKQWEEADKHASIAKVPFSSERTLPACRAQCLIRESCVCKLHSGCCSEYSMKNVATYLAFSFPVLSSLVTSSVFLSGLYIVVRFSG